MIGKLHAQMWASKATRPKRLELFSFLTRKIETPLHGLLWPDANRATVYCRAKRLIGVSRNSGSTNKIGFRDR
jgi:hypothetical protein